MVEGRVAGEVGAEGGGAGFDAGPEDHGYYCSYKGEGGWLVEYLSGWLGDEAGGGNLQPKFAPKLVSTLTSTRITV